MITIRFSGRVPSPRTIEIGQETDSNADKLRFLLPQVGSGQAATLQMIFPDGTADAINITDGMITLPASALDQAGRIRAWVEILAADAVAWHSELFYLDVGELPVISENVEQQYPTAFQDTMAQTTENRRKAEAWAVGQRDGADVESTDETYQNNAKYYSQQGAASAEAAADSAAAVAESEAAAAASAENAAASEAAAAASESNAAESEAAAAASETNAAVSETAAAGSATAAAESAEDAAGSALEAAGSAEDAAASAAAADASAEAAAESAARVDMAVLDSEEEDVDLDLSDRTGNVLVRMAGGHIKTKNFDSGELNAKFAAKQNTLTFDSAPTAGSNNPVKSGGVYTALAGKQDGLTFDSAPVYGSGNPVTSGGVYDAVSEANEKIQEAPKCVTADADADLDLADPSGNVLARFSGGHIKTKNFDSGELNAKFAAKQNALTFDDAPTQGSNNPVKSGGIYEAMEDLQDAIDDVESDLHSLPAVKDSTETVPDLDISDNFGNVLARFTGGHIKTKEFDSSVEKVSADQGTQNAGKAMIVGQDGMVAPGAVPADAAKLVNIFANKFLYHHMDQEASSPVIPAQSLFDIRYAHALGFDMIEANTQRCSDGVYVCKHGIDGTLGNGIKDAAGGGNDYSGVKFSDVTSAWLRANVVYNSVLDKYCGPIPTLEEFCVECKKFNMRVKVAGIEAAMAARQWLPDDMIWCTNRTSARGGFMGTLEQVWRDQSIDDVIAACDAFGPPLAIAIGAGLFSSKTDAEVLEFTRKAHAHGYWTAISYPMPSDIMRAARLGIDSIGSSNHSVNVFEHGSAVHITRLDDPLLVLTGGAAYNSGSETITMPTGATVSCAANSILCGMTSLVIRYSGTLKITAGVESSYDELRNYQSDGKDYVVLANALPRKASGTWNKWFNITAGANTEIYELTCDCNLI